MSCSSFGWQCTLVGQIVSESSESFASKVHQEVNFSSLSSLVFEREPRVDYSSVEVRLDWEDDSSKLSIDWSILVHHFDQDGVGFLGMEFEILIEDWGLVIHLYVGGLLFGVEDVFQSFQFGDDERIGDISLGRTEPSCFDDSEVEREGIG